MSGTLQMAQLDNRSRSGKSILSVYVTLLFCLAVISFGGLSIFAANYTAAWVMALCMQSIFSIQEKNDLKRLYASLSLNDREVVAGRYFCFYVHFCVAILLANGLSLLLMALRGETIQMSSVLTAVAVALCMFSLIISIQTPIYFALGFIRGQRPAALAYVVVLLIPLTLVFAAVTKESVMAVVLAVAQHTLAIVGGCVLISVLALSISYRRSLTGYRKHL